MGDRRTAEIRTSSGDLYVYTHWHGFEFPEMAKAAVKAAATRLGDESYWLRIVVDQLTKLGRDRETGFGLALQPGFEDEYNNDQPSIIIESSTGKITLRGDPK